MVTLEFNAARTTVRGATKGLEERIDLELTWFDRSVEYQNNINRVRGFKVQDARRFIYDTSTHSFPTGLLPRICNLLDALEVPYTLERTYNGIEPLDIPLPDKAWDHQKEIIKSLLTNYRCIAASPTASGKTTSISFILERFKGYRSLIVVPKINLMNNVAKEIEEYLQVEVGRVGGGKESWADITVGVSASLGLHSKGKYKEYLSSIDLLIMDEVHNYSNATGNKISEGCYNTTYRLGLSATPKMENGSDLVLEGVVGPTTLIIPDTVMVELDVIHRPHLYFINMPDPKLSIPIPRGFDKPEREEVYRLGIVEYEKRNNYIVTILKEFLQKDKGGLALILVERHSHGYILENMCLKEDISLDFIHGGTNLEYREESIRRFKSGETKCLIASKILNEGEDIPLLELVINAGGMSGERGIVQKTGRALRKDKTETKQRAIIVDFLDNEPYYLNSNSKKRMSKIEARHPGAAEIVGLEEVLERINE